MHELEPIVLTWKGKDYELSHNNQFEAVLIMEDILTPEDRRHNAYFAVTHSPAGMNRARLSKAFAVALRIAGANVTNVEVWTEFFEKDIVELQSVVNLVLAVMVPPDVLREKLKETGDNATPGKP